VKSEARVCRFCGKDIASDIAESSAKDKKDLERENRAEEQRRRAYAKEQEELKEAQKQRLQAFFKTPWVIGLTSILVIGLIASLTSAFLNSSSERQKLIESKSDWSALARSCEGDLYVDGGDTYQVRDSGREIVVNAYYVAGNPFLDCLGQKIAIDAPADRKMGLHITYAGDTWSGGGLGTMTTEYGNLRISANRVDQDAYIITIR
jgi:hypothetical protein